MTDTDPHELLSALLDREPVDPDHLAALLERPEARALLVDFVRLRASLHDEVPVAAIGPPIVPRRRVLAIAIIQLAAALVLIALGAVAGRRFASSDADTPPQPTRVVRLVPAGSSSGSAR